VKAQKQTGAKRSMTSKKRKKKQKKKRKKKKRALQARNFPLCSKL
jgi:hypothetical protein